MRRNYNFLLLFLFFLLFIVFPLDGAAFSKDFIWSNTFGGSKDDSTNSVAKTTDGGYIIAGFIKSKGRGDSDG